MFGEKPALFKYCTSNRFQANPIFQRFVHGPIGGVVEAARICSYETVSRTFRDATLHLPTYNFDANVRLPVPYVGIAFCGTTKKTAGY